jgi:hypothetical protein
MNAHFDNNLAGREFNAKELERRFSVRFRTDTPEAVA